MATGGCFANIDHVDPSEVETQLGWLREAGFTRVECLHQDRIRVVLAGFR